MNTSAAPVVTGPDLPVTLPSLMEPGHSDSRLTEVGGRPRYAATGVPRRPRAPATLRGA